MIVMLVSRAQLGAAIAEARSKAGLTRAELAQHADLDESAVIALEQGQYKPTSNELNRLAQALGVDELDLLRRPAPGYLII
jgi:transcriptional regulator with XRE-family HTH domain